MLVGGLATNRLLRYKPGRVITYGGIMAVLTGIFYVDTKKPSFTEVLNLVEEPLGTLPDERVRPGKAVLDEVMQRLM